MAHRSIDQHARTSPSNEVGALALPLCAKSDYDGEAPGWIRSGNLGKPSSGTGAHGAA